MTDIISVDLPITEIQLARGKKGLGFNVSGGCDMPHIPGETGIYVTKVRQHGAAYHDGRLREGDRIVAVDNVNIEGVTHNDAVKAFINSGEMVVLQVQQGAKKYILDSRPNLGQYSLSSSRVHAKPSYFGGRGLDYGTLIVVIAGFSLVAFLIYKYRPFPFHRRTHS